MSPNHVRREYKTRASINTRAENKRSCSTMENDHSNQKKRKKDISLIDTEHEEASSFYKDDNTNTVKRVKKLETSYTLRNRNVKDCDEEIDSSFDHIDSNKTVEKIQLPKAEANNSYTLNYIDTPVPRARNRAQRKSTKSPGTSSRSLFTPKVRLVSPAKLLGAPVKWNSLIDSPTESQRMDVSFEKSRYSLAKHDTPTRLKAPSSSETKKKRKNTSLSVKLGLKRFSKSPKIVLKFTKSKSKLKKASPAKLGGSKCSTDSSSETAVQSKEGKKIASKKRSAVAQNVASWDITTTPSTVTNVALQMLKEPVVVLQRLSNILPFVSSPSPSSPSLVETGISSRLNAGNRNASEKTFDSTADRPSKLSTSNEARNLRAKHNDTNTPATPVKLQGIGKTAVSSLKKSVPIITITNPLMSSTPADKRQQNESNEKREVVETSRTYDSALESSSLKVYSPSTRQETTLNVENGENGEEELKDKDGTYELAEPKTPNLRKKLEKQQSSINADSNKKKLAKEGLKVRFTSLSPDTITNSPYGSRLGISGATKEAMNDSSNIMTNATPKKNILKSPANGFRTRLNFVSRGASSPTVVLRRPSATSSQKRSKTKSVTNQNVSSPRLPFVPSVKQPDPKYSASKKIPNFMKIHRRMFAKSESVVDAKKRLEERHTTLTASKVNKSITTKISSNAGNRLPNEQTSNGSYTRFGYRIRKNDAINCIMRSSNIRSIRDKQQEETRAIIKGVRTNRRFELQMKARNKNY